MLECALCGVRPGARGSAQVSCWTRRVSAAVDFSTYKALVVDDEDSVRTVISENLGAMGFVNIDTASDGEEGLKKIRETDVDMVLLDLAMPGVPGEEVVHLALGMKPELLIIVITGFATLDKAITLMRRGIFDLLRKPFTLDEFREKIGEALLKYSRKAAERIGKQEYFGAYRITEEIASGGGGIVYKARDANTGDTVALKVLLSDPHASEEKVLRFHREADTIRQLKHPGIVSIREVGAWNSRHFIAMDFIDGSSLDDLISAKKLNLRKSVEISADVADAVHYAHTMGILHRDLKPSNIIVDRDWKPHIIDFGLAKSFRSKEKLSNTRKIYGTLGYIAPERFTAGAEACESPAMDIFSMGVLLYEMLTNNVPYRIDSYGQFIPNFCSEPDSPTEITPGIPANLSSIVMAAINCDPSLRYASAEEFSARLREFMSADSTDFQLTYNA